MVDAEHQPRDGPVPESSRRNRSKSRDKSSSPQASAGSWDGERGRSRLRRPSNSLGDDTLRRRGYHAFTSFGKIFHVERRWKLVREMGSGAYGVVIAAADEISGETVAIKLVTRVFEKVQLAKRALREITLLRHFASHENITGLIDVDAISQDFNEIYIFMEPMEADLHQIIKSGQALTNEHVQYFLYQILRGMKYVHSANVIHRDLKPGNLLVNADCELKICDFGLSRGFDALPDDENAAHLTEYVATRWYRAPEIMLAFRRYNTAIDVWSIGCILAELLLGKPLFKGKDYVDQLNKVLDVLGTPDESIIKRIGSEKAQAYVRSLPIKKAVPFSKLIPSADPQAIDLLTKMLAFDPPERISVVDALAHPWLATYHDVNDEPSCPEPFEKWRHVEELETLDEFRQALWDEIEDYRREVRGIPGEIVPILDGTKKEGVDAERSRSAFRAQHTNEQPVEEALQEEVAEDTTRADALDSGIGLSAEKSPLPSKSKSHSPAESRSPVVTRSLGEGFEAPVSHLRAATTGTADPVLTYARRSSVMQPTRRGSTYGSPHPDAHQRLPAFSEDSSSTYTAEPSTNHIAFPGSAYVVPARSRTASMAGADPLMAPRRLLRTLSTVSIHESGEGLPIHQFIIDQRMTGADAPPSEMPHEFDIEEEGEEEGKKESRFIID